MSSIKCNEIRCNNIPIIRFVDKENRKQSYCLEHYINRLEYIIENKYWYILENIKKIIPIFIVKSKSN